MAHDVFISYAHTDKATADAVAAFLESDGIRCWIAPRDVRPGEDYMQAITEAIECARLVVLVFSKEAEHSPHVRREIHTAVGDALAILPLRIDDATPREALKYALAGTHWLDAMTPPLEAHLKELSGVVRALMAADLRHGRVGTITEAEVVESSPDPPTPERRRGSLALAILGLAVVLSLFGWWLRTTSRTGDAEPFAPAEEPPTHATRGTVGLGDTFEVDAGRVQCRLDYVHYGGLTRSGQRLVELGYWANVISSEGQNGCVAYAVRDENGYEIVGCGHSLTGENIHGQAVRKECLLDDGVRIASVEYGSLGGIEDRVIVQVSDS